MSGTAVFQSATLATPGAGIVVHTDAVNGTVVQIVKFDVGPAGTTLPLHYALGTGLPVAGIGTFQGLGTYQPLAGSVHVANTLPGTIQTQPARPSAQTLGTRIPGTVGNLILLPANPNRRGATLYLESGSALYLKLGSLAGTLDYTLLVAAGGYYEVPFGYAGTISGIWAFANGTVQIGEVA